MIKTSKRVTEVHIDGLAVLKLVKHCSEALPNVVAGALLGLDGDSVLEITNCIPIPDNDEEKSFQLEMMKLLREINVDNNCIGWYKTVYGGSFCQKSLVETQINYQTNLSENCVCLLFDPSHTEKLWLRAFQLSAKYVESQTSFFPASDLLVELPITIRNSGYISAFLFDTASSLFLLDQSSSSNVLTNQADDQDAEIFLEQSSTWVTNLIEDTAQHTHFLKSNFDPQRASHANNKYPSRLDNLLISFQVNEYCDSLGLASRSHIYQAHTSAHLISAGHDDSEDKPEAKDSSQ